VRKFLGAITDDRLSAAWRLSLYGLRRGEVLGLRWSDIDLAQKTLTVEQTRVLVDYQVVIEKPKSKNGFRTLPLDDELFAGLKALWKRQQAEAEEAGKAYDASGYVVTDELGAPVHPEWYSDEFGRILRSVKLRRITLHDGRHTTLSLMEKAGVPISAISKWAGHYDSAFTQKTYVHAESADLAEGAKSLAKIYKIA
jgi:integrase